jgi:hypothetical protein
MAKEIVKERGETKTTPLLTYLLRQTTYAGSFKGFVLTE